MSCEPLAFFITFHTYGSWLHGDSTGSVDRNHNQYGAPFVAANSNRYEKEKSRLKHPPVILDASHRWIVDHAIRKVCEHRGRMLHALHVQSNHVHLVITADRSPERVMNDCKSWSTRRMVEANLLPPDVKAWARHGSTRYLWTEEQVAEKIDYVLNQQGAALAMIDPVSEQSSSEPHMSSEPRPLGLHRRLAVARSDSVVQKPPLPHGRGSDNMRNSS